MAQQKTKKKKKTTAKKKVEQQQALKRNFRLGLGFLLLLIGCFLTLAVVSYIFSWQQDQDTLINKNHFFHFLFSDNSVIHNWGGRLGAAASHWLVYRGLGICSLLLTIWFILIGINMANGSKLVPVKPWIRWMAFGFLFFCPLLSFVFAHSSFPLGGALGNFMVYWSNHLLGRAGTVLMLIILLCVFVFIIFKWDIQPLFHKAKAIIANEKEGWPGVENQGKNKKSKFKGYRNFTDKEEQTLADKKGHSEAKSKQPSGNKLKKAASKSQKEEDTLEMDIVDTSKKNEKKEEKPNNEKDGFEIIDATKEAPMGMDIKSVEEKKGIKEGESHVSVEDLSPYDPQLDLPRFKFPTIDLLDDSFDESVGLDREELEENKNQIISTLESFSIKIKKISATVGPTITLYEIVPKEGIRISKIRNLEDDIALSLAALGIRIIAPIPGRGTIGIEVPNKNTKTVGMRSLISSEKFIDNKMSLPIAMGKKIDNENYIFDLAKMPHLLIAGATGQGKSVGINAILTSLLYKKHPSQLKFVLVDPKKVELSIYRVIEKHYLAKLPDAEEPIITDTQKVIDTVNSLTVEMDSRYDLLKEAGARNIKEYNQKFIKRKLNPQKGHRYLPFIVLVIDEFADLMMTAGKEVEMPIARLAQLARAVGIHLIIATQRPSVNVITGIIKANFPARIAFRVSAKVDSRTILDTSGAEQLVGRGDMLISEGSELLRLQCAFIDTPEVEKIVNFIGNQQGYPQAFYLPEYEGDSGDSGSKEKVDLKKRDKLFKECAQLVVNSQSGSTSMLQRNFNIGYNRAGRIMDQLEAANIVSAQKGSKPREVFIQTEPELEGILKNL